MSIPPILAEKTGHESSCGIPQVSASINFLLVKGSLFKLHKINRVNMLIKVRTNVFVSFLMLFFGGQKNRNIFQMKIAIYFQ